MSHSPSQLETYQILHRQIWSRGLNYDRIPFLPYDVSVPEAGYTSSVNQANFHSHSYRILDLLTISGDPENDVWKDATKTLVPARRRIILQRNVYVQLTTELQGLDEETREINRDVKHESKDVRGAIVSGHPGIGKRCFLSYLLVIRLLEGIPTIFQLDPSCNCYFRFDAEGVHYVDVTAKPDVIFTDPLDNNPNVWVLCEGMPLSRLLNGNRDWFFVSASQVNDYGAWRERYGIPVYFMDIWSWEEIVSAIPVDERSFGTVEKVHFLYQRYGGIPRLVLQRLFPKKKDPQHERWRRLVCAYDAELKAKAKEILLNAPLATSLGKAWEPSSHLFFTVRPYENTSAFEAPLYGSPQTVPFALQWRSTIQTAYQGRLLGIVCDSLSSQAYVHFLDTLILEEYTRPAAQWVFEGLAHSRLSEGGSFRIESLGKAIAERIEFRITGDSRTFPSVSNLRDTLHELYPPPEENTPAATPASIMPLDEESLFHKYLHITSANPNAPKGLVLVPCGGGLDPPVRPLFFRFASWFDPLTEPAEIIELLQAIPTHLVDFNRFAPFLISVHPPVDRSRLGSAFEKKEVDLRLYKSWPRRGKQWILRLEDRFTKWGARPVEGDVSIASRLG